MINKLLNLFKIDLFYITPQTWLKQLFSSLSGNAVFQLLRSEIILTLLFTSCPQLNAQKIVLALWKHTKNPPTSHHFLCWHPDLNYHHCLPELSEYSPSWSIGFYLVLLMSVFNSAPRVILLRRKAEHSTFLLKTFKWTFTLESMPKIWDLNGVPSLFMNLSPRTLLFIYSTLATQDLCAPCTYQQHLCCYLHDAGSLSNHRWSTQIAPFE